MITKIARHLCVTCLLAAMLLFPWVLHGAGARLFKSGPIQIPADGQFVWVANQDNNSVSRINTTNSEVLEVVLPEPASQDSPRGLSVREDGSEVWVACHDSDRLYVLAGNDGSILSQIDLPWGSGPYSIALSRSQKLALVTLHRAAALAVVDLGSREISHILKPVYWSPMGIGWTEDGKSAWVTHLFAEGEHPFLTRVDFSGAEPQVKTRITVFATDPRPSSKLAAPNNIAEGGYLTTRGHPAQIPSASGRNELWLPVQYNNISEDIYTPDSTVQCVIRRLDLATQKIPGGANEKIVLTARQVHNTSSGNAYLGPGWNAQVAGPVDIAFSVDGSMTYFLNELSDDLLVLPSNTPAVRPAGAVSLPEIAVGNRPKGLVVSPVANVAYVYNQLSRDVSVADLAALAEVRRIALTPKTGEPFNAEVLRGAKIFHTSNDRRISNNSKVSCASCHINSEHDGRTWAFHRLPGAHGPREVPSLLGLSRTMGPRDPATGFGQLHRSGDRDEIQDFEHTFQGIQMSGAGFLGTNVQAERGPANAGRSVDLDALASYVLSLDPIMRSPHRNHDGSLTEAAIRGASFFVGTNRASKAGDAGCAVCHVPETGFVNFKFHDVGQTRPSTEQELNNRTPAWSVNTPTLIGVWTTPPYNGVSGYAPTVIDVLKNQASRANTTTPHGKPDGLTKRQLADLAEFVLSIDGNMTAAEVRNARDRTAPRILRVEPASLTRIDVWFSESIKRAGVTNPSNWRLERAGQLVPVTSAVRDAQNGDRVTLRAQLQPMSQYHLRPAGAIFDEADMASGGVANALDLADAANHHTFIISNRLKITLGASGYENITIPVHDTAMAGPGLSTWSHDSLWLFPVAASNPKVSTAFVRFDWKTNFVQFTGVSAATEILDARFSLHGEMGDAQSIELRRCLKRWSDPATGGDYNQNAAGAPTWMAYSHPSLRWNIAGAGALGGTGEATNDYNGLFDLASRIDATIQVEAINKETTFAGQRVTEAFRFWFDNPGFDYGYALRLRTNATQEIKFERAEAGLQEEGPVLTITYSLPVAVLTIHQAGEQMLLSWPTAPTGFVLESSTSLRPTAQWMRVTNGIASVSAENQLTITNSSQQIFFRLRR